MNRNTISLTLVLCLSILASGNLWSMGNEWKSGKPLHEAPKKSLPAIPEGKQPQPKDKTSIPQKMSETLKNQKISETGHAVSEDLISQPKQQKPSLMQQFKDFVANWTNKGSSKSGDIETTPKQKKKEESSNLTQSSKLKNLYGDIKLKLQETEKQLADLAKKLKHAPANIKKRIQDDYKTLIKQREDLRVQKMKALQPIVSATGVNIKSYTTALNTYKVALASNAKDQDALTGTQRTRDGIKLEILQAQTQVKELNTAIAENKKMEAAESKKAVQLGNAITKLESQIQAQLKTMQTISDAITAERNKKGEVDIAATAKLEQMGKKLDKLTQSREKMVSDQEIIRDNINQRKALNESLAIAKKLAKTKLPDDFRTPQQLADTVIAFRELAADPQNKEDQALLKSSIADAKPAVKKLEEAINNARKLIYQLNEPQRQLEEIQKLKEMDKNDSSKMANYEKKEDEFTKKLNQNSEELNKLTKEANENIKIRAALQDAIAGKEQKTSIKETMSITAAETVVPEVKMEDFPIEELKPLTSNRLERTSNARNLLELAQKEKAENDSPAHKSGIKKS